MNLDNVCHCSIEALQTMSELQNIQAVVDVETILDLVHRICQQGTVMVQCKDCIKTPHSSIATLPALSEQCLPLLEALCSAYDICIQPGFFDSAMLAFEQPPSPYICIRSKVILGKTELDENETRLLVRTLLARGLIRLVELMESLKGVLQLLIESSSSPRNGTALRACESSADSTISRLMVLLQVIESECVATPLA